MGVTAVFKQYVECVGHQVFPLEVIRSVNLCLNLVRESSLLVQIQGHDILKKCLCGNEGTER